MWKDIKMILLDIELFKKCLLQGPTPKLGEKDDFLVKYFDKFYIHDYENIIQNSTEDLENLLHAYPIDWKVFESEQPQNISGRCNFMWLTDDGRAVATNSDNVSHFTILNWAIYNMINTYNERVESVYWNPVELKKSNIHLPVILNKSTQTQGKTLNGYMKKIMINTSTIRLSGPYRGKTFGGSQYGHANKLLETPDFTIESFTDLTKSQIKFIKLVISKYNLTRSEIYISDFTKNQNMERDIF